MIGQNTVLTRDGHDVRSDTHGYQIEQRFQIGSDVDTVVDCKSLHELVAYTTTRQMFVGVGLSFEFGIEDSHGVGQLVVGHMVVADDEINAFALGIGYFSPRP